ncbi:MAG: c-type cytochrome [Blastocatellia bacterium]
MRQAFTIVLFLLTGTFLFTLSGVRATGSKPSAKTVTYSRDVAPVLFRNCAGCHRPREAAPFSVLTYREVRPWAKSIREKVVKREMPPWSADPHYGEFVNDARLSQADIDLIAAWVDGGAKEGSARDLPPAPAFASGWSIGQPDLTLTMPEEFTLGKEGVDDIMHFRLPVNFAKDQWIQAAELIPGNKAVVHHAVIFVEPPQMFEQAKSEAARRGVTDLNRIPSLFEGGGVPAGTGKTPVVNDACGKNIDMGFYRFPILCSYLPGRGADEWPAGAAKFVPKGSNLILQMHYNKAAGATATDRSRVGLRFAAAPVGKEVRTLIVINPIFEIPAGADNVEINACHTSATDVQIIGFMPHMHLRGQNMKFEALYPGERRETLLQVNKYDFNWQTFYKLKTPMALPKGTRVITTAHFDNSARNKRNPNPAAAVKFGQQTKDEMMVIYVDTMAPVSVARAAPALKNPADYGGAYGGGGGPEFNVTREGELLQLVAGGFGKFRMVPAGADQFTLDGMNATCDFARDDKGAIGELVIKFGSRTFRARKSAAAQGQP